MLQKRSEGTERQPGQSCWIRGSAVVLFASWILTACSDPGEPLPGGYFISRVSSSEIFLNEPKYGGSIVQLGTDLKEIGNHNEFIFGRSGGARGTTPGFFLLDTKSGTLKVGLIETNWLALTTAAGIPNPPKLIDPSHKKPLRQ